MRPSLGGGAGEVRPPPKKRHPLSDSPKHEKWYIVPRVDQHQLRFSDGFWFSKSQRRNFITFLEKNGGFQQYHPRESWGGLVS